MQSYDTVDSANGDNDLTPLRNLFNEWFVRDTRKKIRASKRAKGMSGKPTTSQPVYGYLMDKDGNFIVDEETAPVVQQIYRLCSGRQWPDQNCPDIDRAGNPDARNAGISQNRQHKALSSGHECRWADNTVAHILERREYLGCLVNFKAEKVSYKSKRTLENRQNYRA